MTRRNVDPESNARGDGRWAMTATTEHDRVLSGMVGVLWAGTTLGTPADVRDLLDAVAVMRPDHDGARVVLASLHVRARAWSEALRELRQVERAGQLRSRGIALTAVCLYALGDPTWRTYAYAAAYRDDEPMATRIAQALLLAPDVTLR